MRNYIGWTGDIETNDLFTIYNNPALKAEIRAGGDWPKVAATLAVMRAKGELSKIVTQGEIFLSALKPDSIQLQQFEDSSPQECSNAVAILGQITAAANRL